MVESPIRSVLVPLDGSQFAEQALPLATDIARRARAILQVVEVHHSAAEAPGAFEAPVLTAAVDREMEEDERVYLDEVARRIRREADLPIGSALLEGSVPDSLARQIEATSSDLVILTSHGRGPVSRFWLGSVTDRLIRMIHRPLVVIRAEEGRAAAAAAPKLDRILVALDGSRLAERILDPAVALAKLYDAELSLVQILEPPLPTVDPTGLVPLPASEAWQAERRVSVSDYLDRTARELVQGGVKASWAVVEGSGVAGALLSHAASREADLLAIATHGASGVRRMVIGSVADKVLRAAMIPVLVVRPAMAD